MGVTEVECPLSSTIVNERDIMESSLHIAEFFPQASPELLDFSWSAQGVLLLVNKNLECHETLLAQLLPYRVDQYVKIRTKLALNLSLFPESPQAECPSLLGILVLIHS